MNPAKSERAPLTKISTNIQIANGQEDTDHERLTKSRDEIIRMADMIDAAADGRESEGGAECQKSLSPKSNGCFFCQPEAKHARAEGPAGIHYQIRHNPGRELYLRR
ncbi:MAG: hypothetical protein LBF58_11030 [Deltaproteobacteria bacterium]|nr:hypothetical protein [Deltaproteobacteria bacterium]